MDLSFGVGIRSYLHEQLTPLTKDRLRTRILDQIRKYMPFITVEKLDILSREDIVGYTETYLTDESITVKLEYSFPGQSKSQILNIPIK